MEAVEKEQCHSDSDDELDPEELMVQAVREVFRKLGGTYRNPRKDVLGQNGLK